MAEFNKKNIGNKLLGERLREIREKAGVSIEEMANVIKVNKKYLRKIESDDYEGMPSEVYVRGFLKGYSDFLGIKYENVLAIYKKERGIEKNINKIKQSEPKKKKVKIPTIVISFKVVTGIFFALFALGIMGYFYKEANKLSETPRLLISQPINHSTIKDNSVDLVGITDIGAKVTINGQPIFVDEKGGFKERIGLKEGINKLVIKASNKFNKEIVKEITLSSQYKKNIPEQKRKIDNRKNNSDNKKDILTIIVKAKNSPVWISVKVDGEQVYNGTVLADAEQIFRANSEVDIISGKANQTLIKINDETNFHELAEQEGVIRDVVFKKDDYKANQSPEEVQAKKSEENQEENEKADTLLR